MLPALLLSVTEEKLLLENHLEEIACACHEANRQYCNGLGDHSQVCWTEAPDWQRDSAINGVRFAITGDFPDPEEMHANWVREKELDGWVHGPIKDVDAKMHHCLMPYKDLPLAQKTKDLLFRDTCISTIKRIIVRKREKEINAQLEAAKTAVETKFQPVPATALEEWVAKREHPTVTKELIDSKIEKVEYVREGVMMWGVITMQNGFKVTGEPSACVDPRNFDEKKGQEIAFNNAYGRIWALEGYLLATQLKAVEEGKRINEARREEYEATHQYEGGENVPSPKHDDHVEPLSYNIDQQAK